MNVLRWIRLFLWPPVVTLAVMVAFGQILLGLAGGVLLGTLWLLLMTWSRGENRFVYAMMWLDVVIWGRIIDE